MVRLNYLAPVLCVGVLAVVFRDHAFIPNCPLFELKLMEIYVLEGQKPTHIRDLESVIRKGITLEHKI
jgi:hypothetical protein